MRIHNYPADVLTGTEQFLASNFNTVTQEYETVNFTVDTLKTYINAEALAGNSVTFEGATEDDYETVLTTVDPTADRSILLPNASGTIALTSDIDNITDGFTATGSIEINTAGTAVFTLRRNLAANIAPGPGLSMIQFNNSASTGSDDRAAIIEAFTDGGSANATGGGFRIYTKIASSGNNAVGLSIDNTQKVTLPGKLNKSVESAPASATAAGTAGDIIIANDAIYVCKTTGTAGNAAWKKATLATF